MNKYIHLLLDQVAERVSSLIARLVASHIEVRCAEHQAELNLRVEGLASTYEDNGQDEIAARLRSATADLFSNTVVPTGEALLNYAQNGTTLPTATGSAASGSAGAIGKGRRGGAKRISADIEPNAVQSSEFGPMGPTLPSTSGNNEQ